MFSTKDEEAGTISRLLCIFSFNILLAFVLMNFISLQAISCAYLYEIYDVSLIILHRNIAKQEIEVSELSEVDKF